MTLTFAHLSLKAPAEKVVFRGKQCDEETCRYAFVFQSNQFEILFPILIAAATSAEEEADLGNSSFDETTGTIIRFGKTTWELDLRKNPAFGPDAEKLSGKRVVVTGTVRTQAGIEISKRTILTVESIFGTLKLFTSAVLVMTLIP